PSATVASAEGEEPPDSTGTANPAVCRYRSAAFNVLASSSAALVCSPGALLCPGKVKTPRNTILRSRLAAAMGTTWSGKTPERLCPELTSIMISTPGCCRVTSASWWTAATESVPTASTPSVASVVSVSASSLVAQTG